MSSEPSAAVHKRNGNQGPMTSVVLSQVCFVFTSAVGLKNCCTLYTCFLPKKWGVFEGFKSRVVGQFSVIKEK